MPPIFQICPRNRFFCVKFQNWVCFCPVPTTFVFLFWLKNPKFFDVTGNFSDVNFESESCSFYVHFRFFALGWDVHFVVCARARAAQLKCNFREIHSCSSVFILDFCSRMRCSLFCVRARAAQLKKWTSVVPRARARTNCSLCGRMSMFIFSEKVNFSCAARARRRKKVNVPILGQSEQVNCARARARHNWRVFGVRSLDDTAVRFPCGPCRVISFWISFCLVSVTFVFYFW